MAHDSDKPYVLAPEAWRRLDRWSDPAPAVGTRVAYKSEGDLYAGTLIEYLPGDPYSYEQRRAIVRSENPWHLRLLDHFTADLHVQTDGP